MWLKARTRTLRFCRIDAVFVDARDVRHPSLGNVEATEYSAIQQHLRTIQSKRQELEDKAPRNFLCRCASCLDRHCCDGRQLPPPAPDLSVPAMQKHIEALQHEVELRVKDRGAQLKAAPFHSSATLESLPAQSDVLIVVLTPYWYGVETEDGHRGWVHHSQLEPLP